MTRLILPTFLSVLSLVQASPSVRRQEDGGSGNGSSIEWTECDYPWESRHPIQCARLQVPLDYTDTSSTETLELDLIKLSATKEPRLGYMMINPGGPGGSGVEAVATNAEVFILGSGGQYDLIGFDPRGTGRTMPYKCKTDTTNESLERRDEVLYSTPLEQVLADEWPNFLEKADACAKARADDGHLFGTAFVVRDMVQILDALGEDGLLRYYGISYGTLLGWTFAAMFPERVERMILDGNLNPVDYWNGYDIESTDSTDEALQDLVEACVANPDACSLAEVGDADTIFSKFNEFLQQFPMSVDTGAGEVNVTLPMIKGGLLLALYHPLKFADIASIMHQAILGDLSGIVTAISATTDGLGTKWNTQDTALEGISCADWPMRASDPSELQGLLELQQPVSSFVEVIGSQSWACAAWPFESAERYQGPFEGIQTKNPVLFVNPTWDPVTPLLSARNSSATLVDSVVLEHRGHGHGVVAQPSVCTFRAMRDYMVDGTMPADGTVCEVEVPLFSNATGLEALAPLLEEYGVSLGDAQIQLPGTGNNTAAATPSSSSSSSSPSSSSTAASSASGLRSPFASVGAGVRELVVVTFVGAIMLVI